MKQTMKLTHKKSGKVKILKGDKYLIDTNTGVGEPVDYYEVKPYGGRKFIKVWLYDVEFINSEETQSKEMETDNAKEE